MAITLSTLLKSLAGGITADMTDDLSSAGGVASKSNTQTIAHGLTGTPSKVTVTSTVLGHIAGVSAVDGTIITILLADAAGSAVGTPENVRWTAQL